MSDVVASDDPFAGVDFGSESSGPRPPGPLGVPQPFEDEEGNRLEYGVDRNIDWGAETRRPGGGLSYQERRTNVVARPRYLEGDQYDIYGFSPQRITSLQQNLIRAGLLDPDDIQGYGYIGPAGEDNTFDAYERAMELANQGGFGSVDEALISLQSGGYGTGPGGRRSQDRGSGGGGRLPSQISNADDLRAVFRATVIDTLGQGWSDTQIDRLVNLYQAAEQGHIAQAEAMAQAAADADLPSSGTIEALASPEVFARQQARAADPTGATATDFLGAANQFFNLLGGWNPPAGDLPDGT